MFDVKMYKESPAITYPLTEKVKSTPAPRKECIEDQEGNAALQLTFNVEQADVVYNLNIPTWLEHLKFEVENGSIVFKTVRALVTARGSCVKMEEGTPSKYYHRVPGNNFWSKNEDRVTYQLFKDNKSFYAKTEKKEDIPEVDLFTSKGTITLGVLQEEETRKIKVFTKVVSK